MRKIIVGLVICVSVNVYVNAQQIFVTKNADISFFSETPFENINAVSKSLSSVLDTRKNEIMFIVPMRSFKFNRPLMEEHFNEKYVESEKFPQAIYRGKINDTIMWMNDTNCKVTSRGILIIHGIEKQRTDTATLIISNGQINIQGSFNVLPADHNIDIPSIITEKIAEYINVKFTADYMPYKKEEVPERKKKEDKK